jgi:hypothetical protein
MSFALKAGLMKPRKGFTPVTGKQKKRFLKKPRNPPRRRGVDAGANYQALAVTSLRG